MLMSGGNQNLREKLNERNHGNIMRMVDNEKNQTMNQTLIGRPMIMVLQ